MKKRILVASLVVLCLLTTLVPLASSALDITVWIGSAGVGEGETAIVSIKIGDVSDLGYAGMILAFNESVVNVTEVSGSDFESSPNIHTRGPGWVLLEGGQPENGLEGTVRLCNVALHAVGERGDVSLLNLTDVTLDDMQMKPITVDEVINGVFTIPDTIAPAKVTDLKATDPTPNLIKLAWTAPGDDGNNGTAASYDIRYSTEKITEKVWAVATNATGEPTPEEAGTTQEFTVTGLSMDTKYYFAMKTWDEVPNISPLSNVVSETTFIPPTTTPTSTPTSPPPIPPVANFTYTPPSPLINEIGTFNATTSYDKDGKIISYDWYFGDGTEGSGITATHRYSMAGKYSITLKVTDDDELINSTTKYMYVTPSIPPVANFTYTPPYPLVNEIVTFNASASCGTIVSYEWDFGDGAKGFGVTATHVYLMAGEYWVTLAIKDDERLTNSTTKYINVTPSTPPVANFTYTPPHPLVNPLVNEIVTFNAFASCGTIVSYEWDFDDGPQESGITVNHNYSNVGNYPVRLTVINTGGETNSITKYVEVSLSKWVFFIWICVLICVLVITFIFSFLLHNYKWILPLSLIIFPVLSFIIGGSNPVSKPSGILIIPAFITIVAVIGVININEEEHPLAAKMIFTAVSILWGVILYIYSAGISLTLSNYF